MARYVDAIDLPIPPEAAFDYLADFSRAAEWDPGVAEGKRLTPGEPRLGSRFRVVASFLGTRVPLEYRITAFERPLRIVFSGGDDTLRSIDEITFAPRGDGTRVTYEARLELSGIRRLADPALDFAFQYIGRAAAAGLRAQLTRERSEAAETRKPKPRRKSISESTRSRRAKPARSRPAQTHSEGVVQ